MPCAPKKATAAVSSDSRAVVRLSVGTASPSIIDVPTTDTTEIKAENIRTPRFRFFFSDGVMLAFLAGFAACVITLVSTVAIAVTKGIVCGIN